MPTRSHLLAVLLALSILSGPAVAEPVSFRNEVMAVLSRAGCNQGTCHGNLNGKGGFKLSLRGQDGERDLAVLSRDMLARRTDPQRPDESLILQKATARLPHEGGRRFDAASREYGILHRWITQGARADAADVPVLTRLEVTPTELFLVQPANAVTIKARATFSDGSAKDVTGLAVFESTNPKIDVGADGGVRSEEAGETTIVVRYLQRQATVQLAFVAARPDFRWNAAPADNVIDRHVFARLRKLRMNPSGPCSDSEFLRRAYLDLLGVLPTTDESRRFLAQTDPDRRARLVDALLERSEFADHWALKWSDLLRNEEKQLDRKGVKVFHAWIRQAMAENRPLNEFARALIASRGSTYEQPAANYYRALRDPHTRAEAMAQVFLGIRMQCAKCHNHPFNTWTQNDYHQLAAFFARVQYKIVENKRRDKLDKHEFVGEQVVFIDKDSEVKHPVTGAALRPRFLGGQIVQKDDADRLEKLAAWVARADNPFFARTQANRIWAYLVGRGIVDPIDDFRTSNPPANAALLETLARDLAAHRFDQKHLIRTIMSSQTYQLSAVPNATNRDDETNFSHALIRPLPAESLLDAIAQVTAVPIPFEGFPAGLRATQLPGLPIPGRGETVGDGLRFLKLFGKPERLLSCDCERADDATLGQALQLIAGQLINRAVSAPDNQLGVLLKAGKSNRTIIEELYLASLCRLPSERETMALRARLDAASDRRAGLEDVLWALLNSKEFLLRK
jgi:hypothetical protein